MKTKDYTLIAIIGALYAALVIVFGINSSGPIQLRVADCLIALSAILGNNAKGLSAATIVRLKKCWEDEYKEWASRDLSDKEYVYFWADGIHFNVRLDDERSCILVIIASDRNGRKECGGNCRRGSGAN